MSRERPRTRSGRRKPEPVAEAIGARVRELREMAGWTFNVWAKTLRLGRGYLYKVERGIVVPGITALAKMADLLKMSLGELVAAGNTTRDRAIRALGSMDNDDLRVLAQRHSDRVAPRAKAPRAKASRKRATAVRKTTAEVGARRTKKRRRA